MPWPDQTASDQKHINGVTSCQSRLLNYWITWRDLYMAMANGISFQRVQNISVVRSSNIIIRLIARAAINYDWITFRWMILCRYCSPSQSIIKRSRSFREPSGDMQLTWAPELWRVCGSILRKLALTESEKRLRRRLLSASTHMCIICIEMNSSKITICVMSLYSRIEENARNIIQIRFSNNDMFVFCGFSIARSTTVIGSVVLFLY